MNIALTPALAAEYEKDFAACVVTLPATVGAIRGIIMSNRSRYAKVGDPLGIPWWWIGCVHSLESDMNFSTHLHNGDPLTWRTSHVPIGRPLVGSPPFSWEASATDALQMRHLDKWKDWTLSGALYQFEAYNGFGYRRVGVPSPYLWAGSNQYVRGKFVSDHHFQPDVVSKQIGAAVIAKEAGWMPG